MKDFGSPAERYDEGAGGGGAPHGGHGVGREVAACACADEVRCWSCDEAGWERRLADAPWAQPEWEDMPDDERDARDLERDRGVFDGAWWGDDEDGDGHAADPADLAGLGPEALFARRASHMRLLARLRVAQARLDAAVASSLGQLHAIALAQHPVDDVMEGLPDSQRGRISTLVPVRALREVAAEVAVVQRVSPSTARSRMNDAWQLTAQYPALHTALANGRVSKGHVRVVVEAGGPIDDPAKRRRFDEAAVDVCAELTPGKAAAPLARLAARIGALTERAKHEDAIRRRGVWIEHERNGVSDLVVTMSTVAAVAIRDRLTTHAKLLAKGENETRSLDAIRADLATDLLLTGGGGSSTDGGEPRRERVGEPGPSLPQSVPSLPQSGPSLPQSGSARSTGDASTLRPGAVQATVQITVPVLTLLGLDTEPATLNGHLPIALDDAALLAGGAVSWTRVLTHPITGAVLATDRYAPTVELRRYLIARDETCRVFGCTRPATHCDIDHTIAWSEGGVTSASNLAHLCEPDHVVKHSPGWAVEQRAGGELDWRTPTGHRITTRPPPVGTVVDHAGLERLRRFARERADDDPPF